jgi:hypothetical protein
MKVSNPTTGKPQEFKQYYPSRIDNQWGKTQYEWTVVQTEVIEFFLNTAKKGESDTPYTRKYEGRNEKFCLSRINQKQDAGIPQPLEKRLLN